MLKKPERYALQTIKDIDHRRVDEQCRTQDEDTLVIPPIELSAKKCVDDTRMSNSYFVSFDQQNYALILPAFISSTGAPLHFEN